MKQQQQRKNNKKKTHTQKTRIVKICASFSNQISLSWFVYEVPLSTVIPRVGHAHLQQNPILDSFSCTTPPKNWNAFMVVYLQSLSYSFLYFLGPVNLWLETTFGTVQKWSFRPILDSPKGGLNIGILLYTLAKSIFSATMRKTFQQLNLLQNYAKISFVFHRTMRGTVAIGLFLCVAVATVRGYGSGGGGFGFGGWNSGFAGLGGFGGGFWKFWW